MKNPSSRSSNADFFIFSGAISRCQRDFLRQRHQYILPSDSHATISRCRDDRFWLHDPLFSMYILRYFFYVTISPFRDRRYPMLMEVSLPLKISVFRVIYIGEWFKTIYKGENHKCGRLRLLRGLMFLNVLKGKWFYERVHNVHRFFYSRFLRVFLLKKTIHQSSSS